MDNPRNKSPRLGRGGRVEELLQLQAAAAEAAGNAIVITDHKGTIVWANTAFQHLTGYTKEEAIGKNTRLLKSGRQPASFYKQMWETILSGQRWQGQLVNRCKDGSLYDEEPTITSVQNSEHQITHFIGVKQDITERRSAELALRESEEQHRFLLDSTAGAIYSVDLAGNCTLCNSECVRLLGYDRPADLLGKNIHTLIHHTRPNGSPYPAGECRIYQASRNAETAHVEDEVLWRKDGTSFPVEYWSYPVRQKGSLVGSVVTFLDTTERKQAEVALQASQNKFRLLFERTADALMLLDPASGLFVDCNPAAVAMLRCKDRQELLSLTPAQISPPHQPDGRPSGEKAGEMITLALKQGSHRFEWIHCSAHRTDFPAEVLLTPIQTGEQQLIVATVRDIGERKEVEEARQRLAAVIENTTDLVGQADTEGRLIYLNAAGLRMLGADQLADVLGRPIQDFHPPAVAAQVLSEAIPAALRDGMWKGDTELLALDGRIVPVSQLILVERAADGSVKHTSAVMRDLSARKQAEEALRQSEARFRFLFANSPLPMWVFSVGTLRFLEVNDAAIALYGYSGRNSWGCASWSMCSRRTCQPCVMRSPSARALSTRQGNGGIGQKTVASSVSKSLFTHYSRIGLGRPAGRARRRH